MGPYKDESAGDDIEVIRARRAQAPRLALTFTFTNRGSEAVEFTVVEVKSVLGTFATRPERFTLAPGQEGAVDPMLSNLPVNLDELEVSLTLRHGEQAETQVILLQPRPDATVPAASNRP